MESSPENLRAQGIEAFLLENPSKMPEEKKEPFIVELNRLTAESFGKHVPIEETRERGLDTSHIVILRDSGGELVGYGTNDRTTVLVKSLNEEVGVNYFGSGFLKRSLQGNGFYHELNRLRVAAVDPTFPIIKTLVTRTQNPRVYVGFEKICRESGMAVVPSDGATGESPLWIWELASETFSGIGKDFVCEAAYGRELMDKTPSAADYAVPRRFKQMVPSRGDAMVLVGYDEGLARACEKYSWGRD